MSAPNAKLRYALVVLATYLLCLALRVADSTPSPAAQSGKISNSKVNIGTKRVAAAKGIKRSAPHPTSSDSNKFQPRIMQSADQQQPRALTSQYYNSDSWQGQSLLPTFTDQEQGDEMVALASDSEQEQVKVAPPRGKPVEPVNPQKYGQREQESTRAQPETRPISNKDSQTSNKQAPAQLQPEEYYGDEEDDEEELGKANEPTDINQDRQERFKFRPADMKQFEEFPAQSSFEQDSYRRQVEAAQANRSSRAKAESVDSAWLPTSLSSPEPTNKEKSAPVDQQAKRQQPEKIGELFGSGGTFTRADVAIEYLKNILKTKQNLLSSNSNNTSSSNNSKLQQQVELPLEKSTRNRLNSFAPRPFSFFNNTGPLNTANVSANDQVAYEKRQPVSQQQQVEPLSVKSFLSQQADAKFSINDAKPTTTQDFNLAQSATTRLPGEDRYEVKFSRPPSDQLYQKGPIPDPFSYPMQTDLLAGSTPNGTPLGGDYIESLDDFPRGTLRQQQQMFGLESQPQVTIKAQDSRPEDAPIQEAQPSEASRDYPKQRQLGQQSRQLKFEQQQQQQQNQQQQQQSKQLQQQQQQQLQQHQQLQQLQQLHQQSQLNHQHQQQYISENRVTGHPTSSRYFQMNSNPSNQHQISPLSVFAAPVDSRAPSNLANGIVDLHQQQQAASVQVVPAVSQTILSSSPSQTRDQMSANKSEVEPKIIEESIKTPPINVQPVQPKQPVQPTLSQNTQTQPRTQSQSQPQAHPLQHHKSTIPQPQISSKIYREEFHTAGGHPAAPVARPPPVELQSAAKQPIEQPHQGPHSEPKVKPPKIVSYNYFESPTEQGDSELLATNYQLGDALYSSTGGVEQVLSNSELEAIQSQFMTAQHQVVPIGNEPPVYEQQPPHAPQRPQNFVHPDSNLAGILAGFKPGNNQPEELQRLQSSAKQAEEALKELASNEDPSIAVPPQPEAQPSPNQFSRNVPLSPPEDEMDEKKLWSKQSQQDAAKKKKSLIVYLNHPRPTDMSKAPTDGYSLAQAIGEAPTDSFVSAKEFDSHGLSKDSKHLDVSSLRGLGDVKEGQDGLSVVVIGDAYKYKKIVLLISSKSGGLKFIPMVKDMKK